MFGFLSRKPKRAKNTRTKKRSRKNAAGNQPAEKPEHTSYDLMKKISDIQDQLSRHDSRIYDRIEMHDAFLQNQHHEPMKKAAIEIMNKIYNQPAPVREEIVKIIKSDEEILSIIGENKMSAGEVAEKMGLTREHVSRRISGLTRGGVLSRIQEGKRVFYVRTENM